MPIFQGITPGHTIFTLSCVISLWDSPTTHSPSGKELNRSSQEDDHLGIQISFYLVLSLFRTQQQLTQPLVKSSSFPLWKNHVFQGLLFCNVLTLSCLDSLWIGTHPYYSLNRYVHLYYLCSISISKDRPFPKYSETSQYGHPKQRTFLEQRTKYLVPNLTIFVKLSPNSRHLLIKDKFFKTRRCQLFRGFTVFYFMFGLFLQRNAVLQVWSISMTKDRHFVDNCSLRLWWSQPKKVAFFFFFFLTKYQREVLWFTTKKSLVTRLLL